MEHPAYINYWKRKKLLSTSVPAFPRRKWWPTDSLSDIESEYFRTVKSAANILDVGAGDLRVMRKFQAAGFSGEYHTQDIGTEFEYTYKDLSEVTGVYEAVICLDVIEHLYLENGLGLLIRLTELVRPGGVLLLQTPNGRCIRNPLGNDMTHLHLYNLPDLWAFLVALGFEVEGFRVVFQAKERLSLSSSLASCVGRFVTARLLGADYAENIAILAKKSTL
ncbi:methyltransferase domain-containing protein [Telmatocola sphagniphila]|jgi:hypothetical protein|uniref:Methyltransferase domain-containing protein n=1 Tax=Telmatocola sphagniphila TaxID=1123043 RepID=A0A8E6B9C3_9BACT|nr:methyltransferase domain-containing protein [Telmatocola sphagniphila]QVL33794.1 methyltransferase domain-containing protein [Telmatocola sphagniphila]